MVRLKNIEVDNNIAKCEYYPEEAEEFGTIEVDLTTKMVISVTYPKKQYSEAYPFYARCRLIDICISSEVIPNEVICMWY